MGSPPLRFFSPTFLIPYMAALTSAPTIPTKAATPDPAKRSIAPLCEVVGLTEAPVPVLEYVDVGSRVAVVALTRRAAALNAA
jgi:hypothetical protein